MVNDSWLPHRRLSQNPVPDAQPDAVDPHAGHEDEVALGDPRVAVGLDRALHLRGQALRGRVLRPRQGLYQRPGWATYHCDKA